MAKCVRCGKPATIYLEGLRFCEDCFKIHVEREFEEAIEGHAIESRLINANDRIMVAVSGGKDSMVLWYLLHKFNFNIVPVHLNLHYGVFSEKSVEVVKKFSEKISKKVLIYSVIEDFGINMEDVFRKAKNRPRCAVCGVIKRYLINKIALDLKVDSVATGHNLDDGAATTLKAILNWDFNTLSRNYPLTPPYKDKLVKRIKPLYRLADAELKAYADLLGIDYTTEICPYKIGRVTLSKTKDILNEINTQFKGVKRTFYYGYLRNNTLFKKDEVELKECKICGMPTSNEDGICEFCKLTKDMENG
ncbi:MAG: ATP-binding protein [Caldisericum sp.]|uniref:ATP-binding protein n=2 Tax=Caldisericum sp. TaxID=2499687 RepID=UPI003CC04C77